MTEVTNTGPAPQIARAIVGHVLVHSTMTGMRMSAPLLALELGHSKASIGLLVALFAGTQVFLSLPAGRFADRHGLKLPMTYSMVAVVLAALIALVWPVYGVLCVSALLVGGGAGAANIATQRHVGRMARTPDELKKALSWMSLAPAASNFIGPFAAGLMIDHAGYRAAFALLAGQALLGWLLVRTVRERPLPPPSATGAVVSAWSLWREGPFRRLMIMNLFFSISWDLHGFMVPVLGHERGLSASVIGGLMGTFALAAAFIRVALPLFVARVAEWVLLTAATAATGVLLLLYPLTVSPLTMGICSACLGLTLGMVQPLLLISVHQITPRDRHGQAISMRLMMTNATSLATPMLMGAAGGLLGVSAVFWAVGLLVGVGSGLGLRLRGSADGADH